MLNLTMQAFVVYLMIVMLKINSRRRGTSSVTPSSRDHPLAQNLRSADSCAPSVSEMTEIPECHIHDFDN